MFVQTIHQILIYTLFTIPESSYVFISTEHLLFQSWKRSHQVFIQILDIYQMQEIRV